jgi:aspartyl-tRNA(Asn)/glutamyl-tRNA(Gln) amidotransferase subunit A
MVFHSLKEVQSELSSKSVSLKNVVSRYLQNIEARMNLNAFLEVWGDEALAQAELIQQKIDNGTAGKLAGMVIAIKDNICYKNHKVSASSKILEGFESLYSATVVERILAEDAIIIGRLNCDEFAMGSSNETSYYGAVKNPLNENCVPGGSSGGASAAVAADFCLAALGSDTGGSIRQPASFTGIVGMKPTYGAVSRYGLIAYASSFDQIGPMTKCVEDAELLLKVIGGPDAYDSTTLLEKLSGAAQKTEKPRIAYLKEAVESEAVHPEIRQRINSILDKLKSEGYTVEPISFPYLDYMVPAYYVLTTAEASSNLARFDGINYGYRSKDAKGIDDTYRKSRTEGFGREVKRRILLGSFVLSSGYIDAYYGTGQRVRRVLQEKTKAIFDQYDFLLSPTCTDVAFEFGAKSKDPIAMYMQDIFTVHANLTGNPAISIPCGKESTTGLPFGIQVTARHKEDNDLFVFSKALEALLS